MDRQGWSLRMGTAAVLLAVILRLGSTGFFDRAVGFLAEPTVASFLFYLETGRVLRPAPAKETSVPTETSPAVPTDPAELPCFTAEDAALISVRDTSGCTADIETLLQTPLDWSLTTGTPTVLILHTHATESYTKSPGQDYTESGEYRTLDESYNMLAIGDRVQSILEENGIRVIHARTLHDYPSYDGGYDNARQTLQTVLAENPDILLVLDLHRDAAVDENGEQFATSAQVDGQDSAQLMFLLGAGHEHWQQNMALAAKLTAQLETMHPGITRGIITRSYDYNQDLSPGALLVEVGAAGNTQQEALVAAEALAHAILALAQGTQ